MIETLKPYVKYFTAAITPVLLSIQSNGLPTTDKEWAGVVLLFLTGGITYHAVPQGTANKE